MANTTGAKSWALFLGHLCRH